jgi:hypothetical protein
MRVSTLVAGAAAGAAAVSAQETMSIWYVEHASELLSHILMPH